MSGEQSDFEHYSEQVVLLDGQAISFPFSERHPLQSSTLAKGDAIRSFALVVPEDTFNQTKYDSLTGMPIDPEGSIYLCFQNLFKIHPSFDTILIRILQTDQSGHVVLQAARNHKKTKITSKRIRNTVVQEVCYNDHDPPCKKAIEILMRIHFIPRVKSDIMKYVFDQATVILHPFPFGGSKTASDALRSGVPLVTYPQPFLRGKQV